MHSAVMFTHRQTKDKRSIRCMQTPNLKEDNMGTEKEEKQTSFPKCMLAASSSHLAMSIGYCTVHQKLNHIKIVIS
jgi:hypothetical protein